jgi:hypothetical protein
MSYEAFLLLTRLVIHFLTLFVVLQYVSDGARYKFGASMSAALIAGASAALGMQILTRFEELKSSEPMPWLPILCAVILYKLWRANGNVAQMFARKQRVKQ